ncbi:MAG: 8-oxo-dGTP diphosphatase [Acholeplasmataceae bacterium]|nr:8-oxo-dGTP diphosphatase [Acholeplasmataceae bacterium]
MHTYTLGFIRQDSKILMLNRERGPWLGSWNGLGGKLKDGESPEACIRREIAEETGLKLSVDLFEFKGTLTWNSFDANGHGLYLYLVSLPPDVRFKTPIKTREGILDWKTEDWLMAPENTGVAHNIPYFLPSVLDDLKPWTYHCVFRDKILVSVTKERCETDAL